MELRRVAQPAALVSWITAIFPTAMARRNKLLVHINENGPLGFSNYVKPVFLPFPILLFFGFESKLIRISLLSFAFVLTDPFATAPRFRQS
jgi:hypothetical protein